MPKLYFRYGTVGSAKTLNLLAVAHNYKAQSKTVYLVKPAVDTRFGNPIRTRAGLEAEPDYVVRPEESSKSLAYYTKLLVPTDPVDCVLIDEAQFLTPEQVDFFRDVSRLSPVICYGLRTDFQTHLFPGSQRLLEIADTIEEIKTTCFSCTRKAIFNLRSIDGRAVKDGPQVLLGAEESYTPRCNSCYNAAITFGHWD